MERGNEQCFDFLCVSVSLWPCFLGVEDRETFARSTQILTSHSIIEVEEIHRKYSLEGTHLAEAFDVIHEAHTEIPGFETDETQRLGR